MPRNGVSIDRSLRRIKGYLPLCLKVGSTGFVEAVLLLHYLLKLTTISRRMYVDFREKVTRQIDREWSLNPHKETRKLSQPVYSRGYVLFPP
jgi:hypothetical protein